MPIPVEQPSQIDEGTDDYESEIFDEEDEVDFVGNVSAKPD